MTDFGDSFFRFLFTIILLVISIVIIASACFILAETHDANKFWFWMEWAIPSTIGCVYNAYHLFSDD